MHVFFSLLGINAVKVLICILVKLHGREVNGRKRGRDKSERKVDEDERKEKDSLAAVSMEAI